MRLNSFGAASRHKVPASFVRVAPCSRVRQPLQLRVPFVLVGARRALSSEVSSLNDQQRLSRDAVVKIFSTRQRPGWTVPWQTQPVESSTGSGAVISFNGSKVILTAAHVVADSRYLEVQRSTDRFNSEKFRVHVGAVCHDIDLALLSIEDDGALEKIEPLCLSKDDSLPGVFDKVHVVGYPVGGDSVSVTEGVVSRVEVQEYSHSLRPGLALTVDAAINSGNSGGPILDGLNSSVIGVAFQKLVAKGIELQGHAVPAPMIWRFLRDAISSGAISSGPRRLRLPSLGFAYQSLEPPALRQSLGLDSARHGILVNQLHYIDEIEPPEIAPGDVMLKFNGAALDDLGFCDLFGRRLHFAALRDLCSTGNEVPLTIWRDGKEMEIRHRLLPTRHLVPRGQYDTAPSFYLAGGVVFQAVTNEFLMGWNVTDRPPHLQELFLRGHLQPHRKEAVMISQILSDEANAGYDSGWVGAPIVRAVNGEGVRDLQHLVHLVSVAQRCGEPFLRIDTELSTGPFQLVLRVDSLAKSNKRVESIYGVPAPGLHGRLCDDQD